MHAFATNKLVEEINKLNSKSQAEKFAVGIGAYDPSMEKTAFGFSNGKVSAELVMFLLLYVKKNGLLKPNAT
ncbi:hypothetical protein ABN267_08985 [Providencia rettgeri]|uniref:Uncharacterized protein n=1 Tax=Providencia rettgeri TaxID=587 RepID=A0AAW6UFP9_PRORE|nr:MULTISPECIES: hypothetical protein [Providencia]MBG5891956.1 hypothetical protein [Providencia rettgeri]MBI6190008.1 hypothetical protein [Providencia rettgeri]MBQ0530080.1 hypothetical protein [Providencia rettgeri]MDI9091956.1 hypothetical protein [Providencia rettgeri]MDT2035276.1 hypothetical protein [Providencia rettgeri]